MRTLQQFTEDMKDYDVTSEKAGVDPEATFQLGEDVDTYLRLQKEHSVSDESIAFCRSVLASRLTRMDENFEPGRMARIGGSSEIGLGETYAQSDRLYRFRLADGDTEMSALAHVHAIEERMMEAHPEYGEVFQRLAEESVIQSYEDALLEQKRDAYRRRMDGENWQGTSYDNLPAYVTEDLFRLGITREDAILFENEEKGLSSDQVRDTMKEGHDRGADAESRFGSLLEQDSEEKQTGREFE